MSQNGMNGFMNLNMNGYPPNVGFVDPVLLHALASSMQSMQIQQQCIRPPPVNTYPFIPNAFHENNTMIQMNTQHYNQFASKMPPPALTPIKKVSSSSSNDADNYNSQIFKTPTTSMNSEIRALCELQRKALQGCESGAKISEIHGKRPYFKKIDLLCNRMKTDLCSTDKAVININSHGVAWAIKDFIFVFNRIVNAWVILRDYYYSKSEGMQCVNESIDPSFRNDFIEWQNATIKLTSSLMRSFENLHSRDQRNGKRNGKNTESKSGSNSNYNSPSTCNKTQSFHKIFDPLIAENSEQAQLDGGYLKSALYKPLTSPAGSSPPDTPTHDYNSLQFFFNNVLSENSSLERKGNPSPLYKRGVMNSVFNRSKTNLSEKFGTSTDSSDSDLGGILPID